jgi:phosphoenolpyruvate-protein kinase (PTS system EI component)
MASQQIEERSERLEARVATLETELEQMKQILSGSHQKKEPWWLKVAGSFEDDPTFDEAVRLGQEWRKTAE